MNRPALALLALLGCVGLSRAQKIEGELGRPYRLEVVLDIGKHRLMTEVFQEQLKRELEEGLQAAYGDLAQVTVIASIDEKQVKRDKAEDQKARIALLKKVLEDVRKRGLQKALDDWKDLARDGVKTHFVRIDYADGQYEVQTRQHDGLTGQASPVARKDQTADRSFVSRLATILVDRDFGILGVTAGGASPKDAVLKLKGTGLGADLSRWAQKGDVFMVVPVANGAPRALAVRDAYLVVDDPPSESGECRCRVFDRLGRALKVPAGGEVRCVKIHTIKAPLRLRVIQAGDTPSAGSNISLTVRRHGFEGEEGTRLQGSTDSDGLFSTEKSDRGAYDRIAFVTLNLQPKNAIVPVPLVDEQPVRIGIARQTEDTLLTVKKQLVEQKAYECGLAQQELFRLLKDGKANERAKLVDRAKQGLTEAQEMLKELATERAELLKDGERQGKTIEASFIDNWVTFVQKGNVQLQNYIQEQEKNQKQETDPKRLEALATLRQAELEMGRAEFGKALELFRKVVATGFADEKLKAHVSSLEAKWMPKGENHRLAQLYIYDTFPNVNLVKLPDAVDEAAKHFEACRAANDSLTPQKLLQEILTHGGKLNDEEKKLEPGINQEDRVTVELIGKLAGKLRQLGTQVKAYVEEKEGK